MGTQLSKLGTYAPTELQQLELQSQAQQFPKCLPSFSFPICTMEPRAFTS